MLGQLVLAGHGVRYLLPNGLGVQPRQLVLHPRHVGEAHHANLGPGYQVVAEQGLGKQGFSKNKKYLLERKKTFTIY